RAALDAADADRAMEYGTSNDTTDPARPPWSRPFPASPSRRPTGGSGLSRVGRQRPDRSEQPGATCIDICRERLQYECGHFGVRRRARPDEGGDLVGERQVGELRARVARLPL